MKLFDAYKLGIETGIKNDPRPEEEIRKVLKNASKEFDKMEPKDKEYFDQEKLWNPYSDSRFLCGDKDTEVKRLMIGIDIGTGEVLLADRLGDKNKKIDGIVAHHPLGSSKTIFPEVMSIQKEMYSEKGVPINVSESLLEPRIKEITRAVLPANYNQSVDAAKLLDIPIMNIHSPADNCVQKFLENEFEKAKPEVLEDIVNLLMTIPEYQMAAKLNSKPKILVGGKLFACGKIALKMTGGTSGPKEMYQYFANAGVGTVVGMHFPENHIEEAKKHHINIVVAGHMSSDSLGLNLIADEWEKKGIEIVPCSGFLRYSRA